jgi:hydrogenase maturation factor
MKQPVKINKIKDSKAYLFYNSIEIGLISNQLQLNDVRLQIAKQKLSGYYIIFHNGKGLQAINIRPDGSLSRWPSGFFDANEKILAEIVRIKKAYND